ncbi:MAG: hypothetical protein LH632_00105 [Rhodoferax sp.]|nr:hypothetical protein [Rhodoferax sp.]
MASRPKPFVRPLRPAASVSTESYFPAAEVPLHDVIEKDSDSVVSLWNDAMDDNAGKDANTQPATLLMGLPDLSKDTDTQPATLLMGLPELLKDSDTQ